MSASHDDITGFGALAPTGNGQTLIFSHSSNLAFDLIWDPSVAGAPKDFVNAVDAAAKMLVSFLSPATQTIVYVEVGWGEVGGGSLVPGALSESLPALVYFNEPGTDYQDVVNALAAHGDNVTAAQAYGATGPGGLNVAFTTAEGKALGLLPETINASTGPDGAIGFNTLAGTPNSWQFDATGTRASQFNLQAAAVHELTEVMGRVGSEGLQIGVLAPDGVTVVPALTPLDLLTYSAPNQLAFGQGLPAYGIGPGGYFSTDNGVTQMGQFNPYFTAGDVGDWLSYPSVTNSGTLPKNQQDAFDAFIQPGYNLAISLDDIAEMKALGY
jgi:hypothetical protein